LNLENLIGWKLDEAKAALARDESTRATPLRLIETAAPSRKNSNPIFGDWRVLDARLRENETLELVVAREMLDENRVRKDEKPESKTNS